MGAITGMNGVVTDLSRINNSMTGAGETSIKPLYTGLVGGIYGNGWGQPKLASAFTDSSPLRTRPGLAIGKILNPINNSIYNNVEYQLEWGLPNGTVYNPNTGQNEVSSWDLTKNINIVDPYTGKTIDPYHKNPPGSTAPSPYVNISGVNNLGQPDVSQDNIAGYYPGNSYYTGSNYMFNQQKIPTLSELSQSPTGVKQSLFFKDQNIKIDVTDQDPLGLNSRLADAPYHPNDPISYNFNGTKIPYYDNNTLQELLYTRGGVPRPVAPSAPELAPLAASTPTAVVNPTDAALSDVQNQKNALVQQTEQATRRGPTSPSSTSVLGVTSLLGS